MSQSMLDLGTRCWEIYLLKKKEEGRFSMESQSAHSMVCLSPFHRRLAAATPQCGCWGTQGQGHSRSLASEPPGLCDNQC